MHKYGCTFVDIAVVCRVMSCEESCGSSYGLGSSRRTWRPGQTRVMKLITRHGGGAVGVECELLGKEQDAGAG